MGKKFKTFNSARNKPLQKLTQILSVAFRLCSVLKKNNLQIELLKRSASLKAIILLAYFVSEHRSDWGWSWLALFKEPCWCSSTRPLSIHQLFQWLFWHKCSCASPVSPVANLYTVDIKSTKLSATSSHWFRYQEQHLGQNPDPEGHWTHQLNELQQQFHCGMMQKIASCLLYTVLYTLRRTDDSNTKVDPQTFTHSKYLGPDAWMIIHTKPRVHMFLPHKLVFIKKEFGIRILYSLDHANTYI